MTYAVKNLSLFIVIFISQSSLAMEEKTDWTKVTLSRLAHVCHTLDESQMADALFQGARYKRRGEYLFEKNYEDKVPSIVVNEKLAGLAPTALQNEMNDNGRAACTMLSTFLGYKEMKHTHRSRSRARSNYQA